MKGILRTVSSRAAALREGARGFLRGTGWECSSVRRVREELLDYPAGRERNRRLIILFAAIFIFDYAAYSYHTEKNVFDIFPSIPSLGSRRAVTVYLPSLDGATIDEETRTIPDFTDDEQTAKSLFESVVEGRLYENTSTVVPAELFLRKVWIRRDKGGRGVCVFDIEPVRLAPGASVIENSEALFRRALETTVRKNVPGIDSVLVLEKGAPSLLWEP